MTLSLDASQHSWRDVYARLTEIVQPRPIALVSTLSPDGLPNLAPFSFFTIVSANPPYLAFSPLLAGRTATKKDTLRNIEATGEFVVATVTEAIAEQVNQCSTLLPYGESEFAFSGLTPIPAPHVKANLVLEAPVNIECKLVEIRHYGQEGGAGNLVVAQILHLHLNDAILDAQGKVEPLLLQAVGRMGGESWCTTRDLFSYSRPDR